MTLSNILQRLQPNSPILQGNFGLERESSTNQSPKQTCSNSPSKLTRQPLFSSLYSDGL